MSLSQHRQFKDKEYINKKSEVYSKGKYDSFVKASKLFLKVNPREFTQVVSLIVFSSIFYLVNRFYSILKLYAVQLSNSFNTKDIIVFSILLLSLLFILINSYLNSSNKLYKIKDLYERQSGYPGGRRIVFAASELKNELNKRFNHLYSLINKKNEIVAFSEEQNKEIYDSIIASISTNLTKDFFDGIRDNVKAQIVEDKREQLISINGRNDISVARLRAEIEQLSKRANTNLAIGSTVTIAALASLSYFIVSEDFDSASIQKVLLHFLPRLSLVVFIEFFSFFFLKLYRSSLHEIKYYQNELTNIELKGVAISFAISYGNEDDISIVVKEMLGTERNFKLQKGESTVELEKNKVENRDLKEVLNAVLGIYKKGKE
jgi:hypothetical protein